MANLTVTAANVALAGGTPTLRTRQVGEAVTQGEPVYLKADGKYWLADADAGVVEAAATGIALTPAATDGYAVVIEAGKVNLGATLTVGATYVVSATPGSVAPIADLVTGDYVTILGTASTASALDLAITVTGIATP